MRKSLARSLVLLATVALVALEATALGSAQTAGKASVVISTRKLPKLGVVLVDGKGRTLYLFVPDKRKKVTCFNACASLWPPVKLRTGAKPVATGTAKQALLGSDRNPAGGRVVTYNGWPLYTFVGDGSPGAANGQALNNSGGLWYVISPAGKEIRTKP
jgi:predicted lipoprotein with Yx(FWY)xxD motif